MSEDMEQKFEEWLSGYRQANGMGYSVAAYNRRSMRAAFLAGAESQQARIAELEAERDRLLEWLCDLYGMDLSDRLCECGPGEEDDPHEGGCLMGRLAEVGEARLTALYGKTITPKEESRG